MKTNIFIYAILFLGFLSSCGTEENDPTPEQPIPLLAAVSNPAQTVAPFTLVTLDGSQSTGPEGFVYEWFYTGNETINLSSTSEAIITFTPEKNGIYNFVLEITHNGTFSQAQAQVTVTGAVVLDASIFTTDHVTLADIEPTNGMADYLINEDFTIPTGKSITINSGSDINISSVDEAGIIINGSLINDGTLYLVPSGQLWKGVLVDGGSINSSSTLFINKAGYVAFDGQVAAGLVVTNSGSVTFGGAIMEDNVADYGVIITSTAGYSQTLGNLQISGVKYPLMTDMGHFSNAIMNGLNVSNYDYIHLTTAGAGTTVGAIDGQFSFNSKNFYIDGDFTAGSSIVMNSATIYMKGGAGIVGGEISLNTTTIQGLADVSWKGIAGSTTVYLTNSSVIGAGSAIHDTGSFSTQEKAAIHASLIAGISGSTISNSGGYGIYLNTEGTYSSITGTTFTNNAGSDVSLPYSIVGTTIQVDNVWSSSTPVELRSGQPNAGSTWKSLGEGFSYLATTNILINTGQLNLSPGVSIKFATDKSFTVTSKIVAWGTANEPIVFDGVDGTPGSWAGMLLQGQYLMDLCTITNGGGTTFIGAQAAANVVFGSNSSITAYPQSLYSFENNTVSNSADYGATILLGKYDPVTPAVTNTYSSNANGNIKLP